MADKKIDTKVLWQKFSEQVSNFIQSRVSDKQEAEDILQNIFIRIHKGIESLEYEDKVQSWVFGITRRSLVDYYRQKGRNKEQLLNENLEAKHTKDPVLDLNEFEGSHDVHEEVMSWLIPMIDELPDKYAIPLRMADVQGIKQQDIAGELGLSLSGVKSRVQRARQKLGQVLADCCMVEFGEEGRAVAYRKIQVESCEDC